MFFRGAQIIDMNIIISISANGNFGLIRFQSFKFFVF